MSRSFKTPAMVGVTVASVQDDPTQWVPMFLRRSNALTVLGRLETTALVEFDQRLLVFLGFGN